MRRAARRAGHLVKRFAASLSRRPPDAEALRWASGWLLPLEAELWQAMAVADRRHSLDVARRFRAAVPDAERAAMAAALLHDVGKREAGLGTVGRVVATVAGPRGRRFRAYHDHERLGAELLAASGSQTLTVELVRGSGPRELVAALRAADDV